MKGVHPMVARNIEIARLEKALKYMVDLLERSHQYVKLHNEHSGSAKRLDAEIASALKKSV